MQISIKIKKIVSTKKQKEEREFALKEKEVEISIKEREAALEIKKQESLIELEKQKLENGKNNNSF
ncbi:hypothetical protein C2G38_2214650 [Gigaspora rosea]|uniref:Uncharacterized protein n=1 Tax=Gigaspora rosea TaxID=44941 RepID=A0A397UJ57_9GLOM|nr:hypothetical protein C2G38_2214650 [Gigaspora rosea]